MSDLTEADIVELVLLEQLHGQEQQTVDDVSNGATDGLSARPGQGIQITELGIDSDRLQGRKMQGNPQTRLTGLAHDDVSRSAALLGYRGGATDASQSVVISALESISAFSERRGHR